jgi:hypothetical protein
MHKSRLAGFIVDCETEDLSSAGRFWSRALGLQMKPEGSGEKYMILGTAEGDPYLEIQKVSHPSRVHLDIESDDIAAEVARLEKLGARRIGEVKTWCVMEAPTGQRFCVVKAERAGFNEKANRWD